MRRTTLALFLIVTSTLQAGVQEGLAAKRRGDYGEAYRQFRPLAEAGDTRAIITVGLLLQEGGSLLPQNYREAMDWYLKAFSVRDGDAYNNLGVMFRDGLGVHANRRIAYALFLIVHMRGLGSESTLIRANGNLRREVEELKPSEIANALCMSEEFVVAYVGARGNEKDMPEEAKSRNHQRLRDKDWWLESEQKTLPKCAPAA